MVDCSAPQVVGGYLIDKSRKPLFDLTKSKSLWERRIAIVSTQHFIRHDDFADTLAISERLLTDKEDLIHKATGWMLREVGKKTCAVLEAFLDQHKEAMPRTMLRYAIEKFPTDQRRAYLQNARVQNEVAHRVSDDEHPRQDGVCKHHASSRRRLK
ncbi:MAG: DNA alkylation repair protein [Planctomycetes bacterium]|nr:DNA alkylation repair protein [Planctomycetota bacterium]